MALLCYRKGCGQSFDPERNSQDACLYHQGFPIFHDALKGWSCCKKRTTDFSEFLSIKGCTKGYHSHEKPPEPEEASAKHKPCTEDLVLESKSAEVLQRERPSSDEPKQPLLVKVAQALQQVLEKLDSSTAAQPAPHGLASPGDSSEVSTGTACKNTGCQAVFQGEESKRETCLLHPGVPVFHEGLPGGRRQTSAVPVLFIKWMLHPLVHEILELLQDQNHGFCRILGAEGLQQREAHLGDGAGGQEAGLLSTGLAPDQQPSGGDPLCQDPPAPPQLHQGQPHCARHPGSL
ncbi:integrin beta-1-binding protein 2 isoform X4 [Crotalus tigris]|uniref:integrin beta-1-binding protein 2 isoform X4 n=1 Tax=Crotalus tigris TaxID=88082 RepID=UPI00192FA663|nr:integrin beta-1-binding protein 2 isoform X4 [Crotalus tigris]